MSLLESITRGKENKPPRLFVYGQEGVGKTSLAASAPNPVFVQTEAVWARLTPPSSRWRRA